MTKMTIIKPLWLAVQNLTTCIRIQLIPQIMAAIDASLTLSQCTLAGPVYTGMPLECHWLAQCTLGTTGRSSEYLQGTLEHYWKKIVETDPYWNATGQTLTILAYTGNHWKNLVETAPHWDATEETVTFVAYTGTPLKGLQQPTHTQEHIV